MKKLNITIILLSLCVAQSDDQLIKVTQQINNDLDMWESLGEYWDNAITKKSKNIAEELETELEDYFASEGKHQRKLKASLDCMTSLFNLAADTQNETNTISTIIGNMHSFIDDQKTILDKIQKGDDNYLLNYDFINESNNVYQKINKVENDLEYFFNVDKKIDKLNLLKGKDIITPEGIAHTLYMTEDKKLLPNYIEQDLYNWIIDTKEEGKDLIISYSIHGKIPYKISGHGVWEEYEFTYNDLKKSI